jgi:serine O-acetyltransferase
VSIIFKSVNVKLENYYQIKLTCNAQGEDLEFAYYVYKDDEVIEKFPYDGNSSFLYNLSEEGSYRVRTYIRDKSGNKIAKTSKTIDFIGFDQTSIQEEPLQIVIYGVSKNSIFIKSILEKRYKVLCFVDDDVNKFGDEFFGLKVSNLVSIKDLGDVKVIISNPYSAQLEKSLMSHGINNYEFFNFSLAPNNLVIKTMYDQSAIEYRGSVIKMV